jgi:hypothetical protein
VYKKVFEEILLGLLSTDDSTGFVNDLKRV